MATTATTATAPAAGAGAKKNKFPGIAILAIIVIVIIWFGLWMGSRKAAHPASSDNVGQHAPTSISPACSSEVSDGLQILEGSGPFSALANQKTPWINTVGRWIHIVPGNGNFTYDLRKDGKVGGEVRTFKCQSGVFYEVLPKGELKKLEDQSGCLWRQAVYERFTAEEDVVFTVDRDR